MVNFVMVGGSRGRKRGIVSVGEKTNFLSVHQWLPDTPEKKRVFFPGFEVAPIFPASLVGLDQKGTEQFEILERTLRCFDAQDVLGIFVYLIAQARMGLKDLLGESLRKWVENYQLFCQGFFSEHQRKKTDYFQAPHAMKPDDRTATNTVNIVGGKPGEKTQILMWPFLRMVLETASNFQTAVNEMLLQSYSGRIRVFPALPDDWTGCFVLHAVGGFVVTSEKTKEGISYIAIESLLGQTCQVVNPWPGFKKVHVRDVTVGEEVVPPTDDKEICFDTIAGHVYYVERLNRPAETFKQNTFIGKPNQGPKYFGDAILGKPRLL